MVALMNGLMLPSEQHGPFQRCIVVDEVNLLDKDEQAWEAFTRTARLVRHRGSLLMLVGQDLLSVPDALFGLAGMVVTFALRNPRVYEHLRERVGALRGWLFEGVQRLGTGEALVALNESTDPAWRRGARVVRFRPLQCMHGGMTRAIV